MKFKSIALTVFSVMLCCSLISGCGSSANSGDSSDIPEVTPAGNDAVISGIDFNYTDRDFRDSYSETDATKINLESDRITVSGNGAVVSGSGNIVTINDEGTFIISGNISDGRIIVDAEDTDKLQLILNNASVSCSNNAPLFIKKADKVFITLAEGTSNTLTDGSSYTLGTDEENIDAVIFSRADLTVNGSGTLNIAANCNHGIASKDDLVITGGVYNIDSVGDGIQGKDCVKICGGTFTINSGGDGIKSTNSEDSSKGYILLDGGSFTIVAAKDGIQAETILNITYATINLITGGGSSNSSVDVNGNNQPQWGMWGQGDGSNTGSGINEVSAKGLKAGGYILIESGVFIIDSSDDSIHSNDNVTIKDGEFTVSSGDDGIHADSSVVLEGGNITISKSYEGIEGSNIKISGGTIKIKASDDGINAAGGNDGSSINGRPGQNNFNSGSSCSIEITGGYIVAAASGDGIDSNGSITVSGGTILVNGSTGNGDSALDYDGNAQISGGTVVLVGSAGMAQSFGSNSSQNSFMYTFQTAQSANQLLSVADENGNIIVSFKPANSYQNIVVSSPLLQLNNKYTIYTGGSNSGINDDGYCTGGKLEGGTAATEITISSVSTTISDGGNSGFGGGPGGFGGPGGGMGGRR